MQILIAMLMLIDILAVITAGWAIKALVNILDKDEPDTLEELDINEDEDDLAKKYAKGIEGIMNYDPWK